MYEIKLDKTANRLSIILSGSIGKLEGEKCAAEIVGAVNQLKRGFDVITDISHYKTADKKSEEFFKGTLKFMKIRGVRNVVRVVGGSKEALVKFAQVTKQVENYHVKYVPTMEEAEKLLDQV